MTITNLAKCALLGATLAMAAAVAATPTPIFTEANPSASSDATAFATFTPDEMSAAFWVKFDKLPSADSALGLFGCTADKDGRIAIRLFAPPTEFIGDFEMRAKDAVKRGEWHHVEFSYSRIRARAALYLDGRFQWENDNLFLPKTKFGPTVADPSFKGQVRDLRIYDYAVSDQYLAIADGVAESCREAVALAAEAAGLARSSHLKTWAQNLRKAADAFAAAPEGVSPGQLADLLRDARNARALAEASTNAALSSATVGKVALYTVKPLSQEIYLPYTLPVNGAIVPEMRVVASPGEYENGSVLAVAYQPADVKRVALSDLRGPNGKVIPAAEVDIKLVKRWFRSGGAWLSYHSDRRQRNLTPDLLVNDDALIRVDELRARNFLRLAYPEGVRYVDVSDPYKGYPSWDNGVPFRDADTLQPHAIPEAGRNQQYMLTFHVPTNAAPGVYRGRLTFSIPDGDAYLGVALRVLPIDLPAEPSPYGNLSNVYISHMNSFPGVYGATLKQREENARRELASIRQHNMFHTTGIWNTPELAALAREVGFIPDKVFGGKYTRSWRAYFPTVPPRTLTPADKEAGTRAAFREMADWQDFFTNTLPAAKHYIHHHSEDGSYGSLANTQAEEAHVDHLMGNKVFAHTMGSGVVPYMADIQDMTSSTTTSPDEARMWHAVGGEMINYADPFPGSENPVWYRRKIGLLMYKAGLDGQMMHGYRQSRTHWNEFAEDIGGDGNYRNFSLCYPMRNGTIYTISWEGVREAYDDLRYATRLRQLASANLDAKDEPLRREAKRAQLWLERLDGATSDLDMVRAGLIHRILILQETIKRHGGVIPSADMAHEGKAALNR